MLPIAAAIGVNSDVGKAFVVATSLCVVVLCWSAELLLPTRSESKWLQRLAVGSGRGCLIGLAAWVTIMMITSIMVRIGDKFLGFALMQSPTVAIGGAVAGGIVSAVFHIVRRRSQFRK